MHVTVSAIPPICRNWRNAYIISLSKGLDPLEGQAAVCIAARDLLSIWHQNLDSLAAICPTDKKVFVRRKNSMLWMLHR